MPMYIYSPFSGNTTFGNVTATGQFLAANGTVGAPAYSFSGDATTGMFYNSGVLYFSNGGAQTLNFSSSGIASPPLNMTAGTMNYTTGASLKKAIHRFDWTNAMVVALGGVLVGDISVCSIPAKTVVTNCYMVITTPSAGLTTLTVAVGRVGAAYIDYIVASDGKAAANTVYGDASAERGTNLTGYDLPNFTSATTVYAHFISTVNNLSAQTAGAGSIYIETLLLP